VNGPGSTIRDMHSLGLYSFSPGCTLFSAGGMAQIGEWSRLRNWDNYSSLLEKNSPDNSSLMFYLLMENALPDLTDVSGRMVVYIS
jgi:hypothetical protein